MVVEKYKHITASLYSIAEQIIYICSIFLHIQHTVMSANLQLLQQGNSKFKMFFCIFLGVKCVVAVVMPNT